MSKKAKQIAERVFSYSQAEAVGYLFGASNLGLMSDKTLYAIVKKYIKEEDESINWRVVQSRIRDELGRYADSDMMFRDMLEECHDWVNKAHNNDKFILDSWEADCKKFDIPEKHIFSKS